MPPPFPLFPNPNSSLGVLLSPRAFAFPQFVLQEILVVAQTLRETRRLHPDPSFPSFLFFKLECSLSQLSYLFPAKHTSDRVIRIIRVRFLFIQCRVFFCSDLADPPFTFLFFLFEDSQLDPVALVETRLRLSPMPVSFLKISLFFSFLLFLISLEFTHQKRPDDQDFGTSFSGDFPPPSPTRAY